MYRLMIVFKNTLTAEVTSPIFVTNQEFDTKEDVRDYVNAEFIGSDEWMSSDGDVFEYQLMPVFVAKYCIVEI